jgi:alpha-tubulin suppressor-like RCC1 family protein
VSSGNGYTCATTETTGEVWCWGNGRFGQLGFQVTASPFAVVTPTMVPGLTGITGLSAGGTHTCAIQSGEVVCWGANFSGELGMPGAASQTGEPPATVPGLSGVRMVSAGLSSTTCAVLFSGSLYCWGTSVSIPPNNQPVNPVPAPVAGIQGALEVRVGSTLVCALTTGGRISCWGNNATGAVSAPLPHVLSPARVAV